MPFWKQSHRETPHIKEDKLEVHVEGATNISAEVVRRPVKEGTVAMYLDGAPVDVPLDAIPRFQARGFVLQGPVDLPLMAQEISILVALLGPSMDKLIGQTNRDGVIDAVAEGEFHVLTRLWTEIEQKYQQFLRAATGAYEMKGQS